MEDFLWGSQDDTTPEFDLNVDDFNKDFSIFCESLICQEIAGKDFNKEKLKKIMRQNNVVSNVLLEPTEFNEIFDV
jgi:hypothetical protein